MATMTKAEVRSMVQQVIDDPNAKFWPSNNLDLLISMTIDDLWSDLLDYSPYFLSKQETLTGGALTAPGFINTSALAERFHRLQHIVRNDQTYVEYKPRDLLLVGTTALSAPDSTYAFYGPHIYLFPLDATTSVDIRYSYKPAKFSSLADGASIAWPEGHESALVYEAAARAMAKGDRENIATIQALADRAWNRLIGTIHRRSLNPIMPFDPIDAQSWGGV